MSTVYTPTDAFAANVTIPDDGDPENVASVNVAFEGLANNALYLKNRIGSYRLADMQIAHGSNLFSGNLGNNGSGATSRTSVVLSSGVATLAGDIIEIGVVSYVRLGINTGTQLLRMQMTLEDNQNGGGVSPITNGDLNIAATLESSWVSDAPFTSQAFRTIATPGTYAVTIKAEAINHPVTSADWFVDLQFPYFASYKLWRPN